MTIEECTNIINNWVESRHKLPCPIINKHCSKSSCRFYIPLVNTRPGPDPQHPECEVIWVCQFDQTYLDTVTLMGVRASQPQPRTPRPPTIVVPGAMPKIFPRSN